MLRGQASLQEIIGRPQSWRRSSKPRTAKLENGVEGSPAAAQEGAKTSSPPTAIGKRRRGLAVRQESSPVGKAPDYGLESPFASQEEQKSPAAAPSLQGSQSLLRRSPRTKARSHSFGEQSVQATGSTCPVCSKQLPLNDVEINRHLGVPTSSFLSGPPLHCCAD